MQVSVSHTDKFDLRIYTHMLETQETRVQSLGQENPMEEKMTTTPVFLPGKFHKVVRQARHKESDMTEHSAYTYTCSRSLQLCPTLCDPMDCSPAGSSVRGILQTRILKMGAISYSRGSSRPRFKATSQHHQGSPTYIHTHFYSCNNFMILLTHWK